MTPACTQDRCNSGRAPCPCSSACQTTVALPPFLARIRRVWIRRSKVPLWYRTNRTHGFSRRRALWLAWRTTNPITPTRKGNR